MFFTDIEKLRSPLSQFFASYCVQPDFASSEFRSELSQLVRNLLGLEADFQQKPHTHLILFVHLSEIQLFVGIDGGIYADTADGTYEQKRLEGELGDGTVLYNLSKWSPAAFLPCLVLFLLDRYCTIYFNPKLINRDTLLRVFEDELVLAINAFRIAQRIEDGGKAPKKIAEDLCKEIKRLITSITNDDSRSTYSNLMSIPAGIRGHTLYLNLFVFEREVYLRIDDLLSKTKSYRGLTAHDTDVPGFILTTFKMDKFDTYSSLLSEYFIRVFEAKLSEDNDIVDLSHHFRGIYNKKSRVRPSLQLPAAKQILWTTQPQQNFDNCVVVNYLFGMFYRLERFPYKDKVLMDWLYRKFITSSSLGRTMILDDTADTDYTPEARTKRFHKARFQAVDLENVKHKSPKNERMRDVIEKVRFKGAGTINATGKRECSNIDIKEETCTFNIVKKYVEWSDREERGTFTIKVASNELVRDVQLIEDGWGYHGACVKEQKIDSCYYDSRKNRLSELISSVNDSRKPEEESCRLRAEILKRKTEEVVNMQRCYRELVVEWYVKSDGNCFDRKRGKIELTAKATVISLPNLDSEIEELEQQIMKLREPPTRMFR